MLNQGERGDIELELEELVSLVNEIPQEELRGPLNEMLNEARGAWQSGDDERAIQMLEEARMWIEEHSEELGDPPAGELYGRLEHILILVTEPGPP